MSTIERFASNFVTFLEDVTITRAKDVKKHAEHTQSDHGNWARYGGRAESIAEARARGLDENTLDKSLNDLENVSDSEELDLEKITLWIENDPDYYNLIRDLAENEAIDYLDTIGIEATKEQIDRQIERIFFDVNREQVIDDNIDDIISKMEQEGDSPRENVSFAQESMRKVFNISHDTDAGVIESRVQEVTSGWNTINIDGNVYLDDYQIGGFARTFTKSGDKWQVSHDIFQIEDESAQGLGFGRKFIEAQENAYVAMGVKKINLYSAWDGAYTWSRAGYDFNPFYLFESINNMRDSFYDMDDEAQNTLTSLFERARSEDMSDPSFPLPYEFAKLPGAKEALFNTKVYFEKYLTAEGINISEGAIDRDGDGLIFDGTPRERPAPKN